MGDNLPSSSAIDQYGLSSQQSLCLQATLGQGDAARSAWRAWRSKANFDQLEPDVFPLLPLLSANLQQLGVTDPWLELCKGIHRRTWYKNQLIFKQVSALLAAFQAAGIDTLLLKDVPVALLYYREPGLRPVNTLNLLTPVTQLSAATELLRTQGWLPKPTRRHLFTQQDFMAHSTQKFVQSDGLVCILHWSALPQNCAPALATVPITVNGRTTQTLSPSEQLLDLCVAGIGRPNPTVGLQWIPDALMVLQTAASAIDWAHLLQQATRQALNLTLSQALTYLHTTFDAAIPSVVLQQLAQAPVQRFEQQEAWAYRHWSTWGKAQAFGAGYQRYKWLLQQAGAVDATLSLPQYGKTVLALDSFWQAPFKLAQMILARSST